VRHKDLLVEFSHLSGDGGCGREATSPLVLLFRVRSYSRSVHPQETERNLGEGQASLVSNVFVEVEADVIKLSAYFLHVWEHESRAVEGKVSDAVDS